MEASDRVLHGKDGSREGDVEAIGRCQVGWRPTYAPPWDQTARFRAAGEVAGSELEGVGVFVDGGGDALGRVLARMVVLGHLGEKRAAVVL